MAALLTHAHPAIEYFLTREKKKTTHRQNLTANSPQNNDANSVWTIFFFSCVSFALGCQLVAVDMKFHLENEMGQKKKTRKFMCREIRMSEDSTEDFDGGKKNWELFRGVDQSADFFFFFFWYSFLVSIFFTRHTFSMSKPLAQFIIFNQKM